MSRPPSALTPPPPPPVRLQRPFLRFLAVGATAFGINVLLFLLLIEVLGLPYLAAALIVFLVGNFWGWAANRSFTFKSQDHRIPELSRYLLVTVATLLANLGCMYTLVDLAGLHYLVAALVIGVLFLPLNYSAHRVLTFRARPDATSA